MQCRPGIVYHKARIANKGAPVRKRPRASRPDELPEGVRIVSGTGDLNLEGARISGGKAGVRINAGGSVSLEGATICGGDFVEETEVD